MTSYSFIWWIIEPGTIHNLTINVLSNSSINISWQPPLISNGIILHYYISIRSLTERQFLIFETKGNVYTINNLSWLPLKIYLF